MAVKQSSTIDGKSKRCGDVRLLKATNKIKDSFHEHLTTLLYRAYEKSMCHNLSKFLKLINNA